MRVLVLGCLVLVNGCYHESNDLSIFMNKVKATTVQHMEPIAKVRRLNHYEYTAFDVKSPFSLPQANTIQQQGQQMSACLSPDIHRLKQPLEIFEISELIMRGTIGHDDVLWALIESPDLTLHNVSIDNYLGMFNGRIINVGSTEVTFNELILDGAGCWIEQKNVIKITQSQSKG